MDSPTAELDGWISVQDVAVRFNISKRRVYRMVELGRLPATKIGWAWLVHENNLPDTWPPPRTEPPGE